MTELKPCPFCGAPAKYTQYSYDHPSAPCTYHLVRCTECCAKVETTTTAADAMEQWNRRYINGMVFALSTVYPEAKE